MANIDDLLSEVEQHLINAKKQLLDIRGELTDVQLKFKKIRKKGIPESK